MLLAIRPPADNERDPLYMQAVLSDLLKANAKRHSITLIYGTYQGEAQLFLELPNSLATIARGFLHAKYPGISIQRIHQSPFTPAPHHQVRSRYLRLKPDVAPLRLRRDFEDLQQRNFVDPVSGLLHAVEDTRDGTTRAVIRISLRPVTGRYRRRARRILQRSNHPFFQRNTTLRDLYADWANSPINKRLFTWPIAWLLPRQATADDDARFKIDCQLTHASIELQAWGPSTQLQSIHKRLAVMVGAFGEFVNPGRCSFVRASRRARSLLSDRDLALLWHLPTDTVHTATMARPSHRQLSPPVHLTTHLEQGSALLGRVDYHNDHRRVCIDANDRLHTLIVGKSGVGKSTLMHNLTAHDCQTDAGICVIDPHGDLINDVLSTIPSRRTNDVVLMDVADRSQPVTFNPLYCTDPLQRPLIASSLLSALKKVFGFDETNAPRLINTLRYTLLAILEKSSTTLLDVSRMLKDKRFRNHVTANLSDAEVRSFWLDEVANWTPCYENETMPAILNKLGQFTANPITRAILADPVGSLNIRQAMDRQQIVLVSLSQGLIGEDAAALLGSLLVAGIQQAAMSRADLGKETRTRFYLYVDEYLVFVNESLGSILSQARKYGLYLTAAQQFIPPDQAALMAAMFGNISTLVCFQVAFDDAQVLADQLGEPLTPTDLISLPKYHAVTRLAIRGVPTSPFSIATLPPPKADRKTALADTVRRVSRRRYGCPTPLSS